MTHKESIIDGWKEDHIRQLEAKKLKEQQNQAIGERIKRRINSLLGADTSNPAPENSSDQERAQFQAQQYNSDTLFNAVEQNLIPKTPTGLLDGVFLLGSTNSRWREETVEPLLAGEINTYNPNMSSWDPEVHPKAEALGMSQFAVLAMRIENMPGVTDGSLGSLVEIGMAAFSALINGQKVIITFDEAFEGSLVEPGAIAQYEALKVKFDELRLQYPGLLQVEYNCSREKYVELTRDALQKQRNPESALQPIQPEQIQRFAELRQQKLHRQNRFIVYGGSSKPYSPSLEAGYQAEQDSVHQIWGGPLELTILNQPPFSDLWNRVDEITEMPGLDDEERKRRSMNRMRQAFLAEQGLKDNADVLLWAVQDESISKAAVTEIGFMMLNALEKGQQLVILLEAFDADKFTRVMLKENMATFEQLDPNNEVLAKFKEDEQSITFKMVAKNPVLAGTPQFKKADNARRTRAIAQEQIKKLSEQIQAITVDQDVELFSFSTNFNDYLEKNQAFMDLG